MAYGIEMLLQSSPTGFGTLPKHVTPLPLDGVCDRCKDVRKAGTVARLLSQNFAKQSHVHCLFARHPWHFPPSSR